MTTRNTTTTTRKKTGLSNKAATLKTTRKTTKRDISLLESSLEERWKVIAVAAYHKAEKRGFAPGDELQDWVEAEKEVDTLYFG